MTEPYVDGYRVERGEEHGEVEVSGEDGSWCMLFGDWPIPRHLPESARQRILQLRAEP